MIKIREAKQLNRWSLEGLDGEFEKITKGEAKQLSEKELVEEAIYGDRSIGHFVQVSNVEEPKEK